jgi:excisionase family DNA binding protein
MLQAAERLGVTDARVQALILSGRLPSQQFRRSHMIKETDLRLVSVREPRPGEG